MSKGLSTKELIESVRKGGNPATVLFGTQPADVFESVAPKVTEMLNDSAFILRASYREMKKAYAGSGVKLPVVEDALKGLISAHKALESATQMVKPDGEIENDPTKINPTKTEVAEGAEAMEGDDEMSPEGEDEMTLVPAEAQEEEEPAAPGGEANPAELTAPAVITLNVTGVENSEEFKAKLDELIAQYGGVAEVNVEAMEEEDGTLIYSTTQTDQELPQGGDVKDEGGNSASTAAGMAADVAGSDPKATDSTEPKTESRIVRLRLSEGLKMLAARNINKSKVAKKK